MKIERFIGGMLESNGYVIYQKDGGNCYVIDPGYHAGVFEECIDRHQLHLSGILLTHHHYDHVGAVEKLRDRYDAPVFMHTADCDQYHGRVDVYLEDGDTIDLDGETIRVIHTPGHTRGGVCYFSEKSKVVFTGDTIFNVDIGRTDFEDGSPDQMERSILDKINTWPNDIFIYPGGTGTAALCKKVRQINTEFLDVVNGGREMSIKLIALDLDGNNTEFCQSGSAKRTCVALETAAKQGCISLWQREDPLPHSLKMCFHIHAIRYMLTSNGAAITDLRVGAKVFYENCLSAGTVEAAVEMLKSTDYILEGFNCRKSIHRKRLTTNMWKGQAKSFS